MEEQQKLVGPVIRGASGGIADAVLEAIENDNPDAEVFYEDRRGYVRINIPRHCRLTRKSMEEALGKPFELSDLEPALSAFAGRMRYEEGGEAIVWYLEREG